MNKYLFIIGLVGTALFTACSTADDLISEKPIETPPVEEPKETALIVEASQNSEVPITLGVGESRGLTRKPIESGEGNLFSTESGKYLGVFCLATDPQSNVSNIPTEISTNKWVKDDATGLLVRFSNVPAKVADGVVTFVDPANTSNPKHYFYPMGNWMVYNFYSYYPREDDENISFTKGGSGVLVKYITINGSQDVIWGKSYQNKAPKVSTANDADPFCAKYFRLKKDSIASNDPSHPEKISELYPKMEFEHLLSQFKFFIEPESTAAWTAISGMGGMAITDMYISNAISNLQLIVANKVKPETEGTLSKKDDDDTTENLYIKANGKDYNLFTSTTPLESQVPSITIEESQVSVPGYIMLPPIDGDEDYYELCLDYSIGGMPKAEPMKVKLTPPSGGFKAGHVYNIVVKVKKVIVE